MKPSPILTGTLAAALVLFAALWSLAGGDETAGERGLGLEGNSRDDQSGVVAADGEIQPAVSSQAPARTPALEPGKTVIVTLSSCLFGRVMIGDAPHAGAGVILEQVDTTRSPRRALDLSELPPDVRAERVAFVRTLEGGHFQFEGLSGGLYRVTAKYARDLETSGLQVGEATTVSVLVSLRPGETLELEDVLLFDGSERELLASRGERQTPARIHVTASGTGLKVLVLESTSKEPQRMGFTDADGTLEFSWKRTAPIRIDIENRDGLIVGSTDSFETYSGGADSQVPIETRTGSLVVTLPGDGRIPDGSALQLILEHLSESGREPRVETIHGGRRGSNGPTLSTAGGVIEIKALRVGAYNVKAIWMELHENGRWYPVGQPLRSEADVRPGMTANCRVL